MKFPPANFLTLVFSILFGAMSLPGSPVRAQQVISNPGDEAGLYAAAKREGTVVWYGGAPPEPMKRMAAIFEQKYPGVRVEILRIVGVAQYQRFMMETEAKQYIADVLHVGDEPSMEDLVEHHHVVNWKVPTYDRVPEDARIKTNAYASYIVDQAIGYNPNKVTPEEVKILAASWKGILDPRFKGRIALSPQKAGATIALMQMFMESKYKGQFGLNYLKAVVAQKPVLYADVVVPADRVIAGEQDIVFGTSEGGLYSQWDSGAPIRWVHPKPTPAFGNTWFGVSAYAPHPNAARLFLNWAMSDDGAQAVQTGYGGIPLLKGVVDQRPVTKEPWYDPITDRYVPDWKEWVKTSDRDINIWIDLLKASQLN